MNRSSDADSIVVKWETFDVKADVVAEDEDSDVSQPFPKISEGLNEKFSSVDNIEVIAEDYLSNSGQEELNSEDISDEESNADQEELDSDDISDEEIFHDETATKSQLNLHKKNGKSVLAIDKISNVEGSNNDPACSNVFICEKKRIQPPRLCQKNNKSVLAVDDISIAEGNNSDQVCSNAYVSEKKRMQPQPHFVTKKKVPPSPVDERKCQLILCTRNHKEIFKLSKCLHMFFRDCLSQTILKREDLIFICPFKTCNSPILEPEIKEILGPKDFDEYLTHSLLIAEKQSDNSFHCKTPGCIGWCIYDRNVTIFQCLVCKKTNCLLCKKIHITRPCKQLDDLLNYPDQNNTASLGRTKNNALKLYPKLLDLYRAELVLYPEEFTCPICFEIFFPMEGIILKNCLHVFCRGCLQKAICLCETEDVKCPYVDDNYACESMLFEYEIKALLSPNDYEERLKRTFIMAESKLDNTFHCQTADCKGWCIIEGGATQFLCYICGQLNCTVCLVIHEGGQSCFDYQDRIHTDIRTGVEGAKSDSQIQEIINRGDAMQCPKCRILIMKTEGCDGITCSRCGTDICWVTKMRRWGPQGKGDYSGGCMCQYNGRRCHPNCGNCH